MAKRRTTWGRWTLKRSNWTLVHVSGYEVDLEEMDTGYEVLDWICHLSEKEGLTTREDIGYFVAALSEIFYHLPSTFATTFARGHKIDATALLKKKFAVEPDQDSDLCVCNHCRVEHNDSEDCDFYDCSCESFRLATYTPWPRQPVLV